MDFIYTVHRTFTGSVSLERVQVLKRSAKRFNLVACSATHFRKQFSPDEINEIFSATPEAAVERWREKTEADIEGHRSAIEKLTAQLSAELPRGF